MLPALISSAVKAVLKPAMTVPYEELAAVVKEATGDGQKELQQGKEKAMNKIHAQG